MRAIGESAKGRSEGSETAKEMFKLRIFCTTAVWLGIGGRQVFEGLPFILSMYLHCWHLLGRPTEAEPGNGHKYLSDELWKQEPNLVAN